MINLVFILLLTHHVSASLSILTTSSNPFSVSTHDCMPSASHLSQVVDFQLPTPHFNRTGLPVYFDFKKDKDTGECIVRYKPISKHTEADESILVLDLIKAYRCNYRTYGDAFAAISDYPSRLKDLGLPPAKTCVLLTWRNRLYFPNNPAYEMYSTKRPIHKNSWPPDGLDVAIVNKWDGRDLMNATNKALEEDEQLLWTVVQEPGAWNALFASMGFLYFSRCIFTLDVFLVMSALVGLYKVYAKGDKLLNMRNAIVVLAVISTTLYGLALLYPIYWNMPKILGAFASWTVHLAFYLLLYLWSTFLQHVERKAEVAVKLFQWATIGCAGISFLEFVMELCVLTFPAYMFYHKVKPIIDTTYSSSRILIAFVFLIYAAYFLLKRGGPRRKLSQGSSNALLRLAQLGVVTFFTFGILSACQLALKLNKDPKASYVFWITCVRYVTGVVRSASLLLVLGVHS